MTPRSLPLRQGLLGLGVVLLGVAAVLTSTPLLGAQDGDESAGLVHSFVGNHDVVSAVAIVDGDGAANLEFELPSRADVNRILLRWVGVGPEWNDTTVRVDGSAVTAERSWTRTHVDLVEQTNVVDVTDMLDLVSGNNEVAISGLDRDDDDLLAFASLVVVHEASTLPEVTLTIVEQPNQTTPIDSSLDGPGRLRVHETVACTQVAPAITGRTAIAAWRTSDSSISTGPETVEVQSPGSQLATTRNGFGQGVHLVGPFLRPRDAAFGFAPSLAELQPDASDLCLHADAITVEADEYAGLLLSEAWFAVPTVHRVGNLVFLDSDADGVADPDEPGIGRLRVELWDGVSDALLASTITDDEGRWAFEGLVAGRYRVSIPKEQVGQVGDLTVDLADAGVGPTSEAFGVDNDNNADEAASDFRTGLIRLGDEGLDDDFANFASSEPTTEVDRSTGEDDDPFDLSIADGDYDDVRSDFTMDIGIVPSDAAGQLAEGEVFLPGQLHSNTVLLGDTEVTYMVAAPEGFEAGDTVPVVLAFPPSSQSFDRVASSMATTWGPEALERGWVVVSPAAPDGVRWFEGSENALPALADWINSWVEPAGGGLHLAGYSNGGISAFRAAALLPDQTSSVVGFPGYALSNADREALVELVANDVPVRLFVGADDSDDWLDRTQTTRQILEEAGGDVSLVVVPDEPHVIDPLMDGQVVFNLLTELG